MNDPGEGSSAPPRYVMGRSMSHRSRLSLVNDIEEIDHTSYVPTPRPLTLTSVDSSKMGMSPPGSPTSRESHSRNQSFNSLPVPSHYMRRPSSWVSDDPTSEQIGHLSIMRPAATRSNSAHTASSYGALAISRPTSVMTDSVPPPVPTMREGRLRDYQIDGPADRAQAFHASSSYPPNVPRAPPPVHLSTTPMSPKQVRFNNELTYPGDDQIPLPPHAADALAEARRQQALFFHGPPPLHGDDVLPPPYKGKRKGTDYNEGGRLGGDEKGNGGDDDEEPPLSYWQARKKRLWLALIIGILAIIVGIIAGVLVAVKNKKNHNNSSQNTAGSTINGTASDFPPPTGFLGTWSFTTQLRTIETACSPAPVNASTDLWRCYPFSTNNQSVVWSLVISTADGTQDTSATNDNTQLMIQSTANPFTLNFPAQDLNLTRTITDAYYEFSYSYSKTTLVAFGNSVAECEFPNSVFSGQLHVNNSIFSTGNSEFSGSNKQRQQTDVRGEWPGNIVLQEEKMGGGGQILCRDRATQNVLNLGTLTADHGNGNCLCGYNNF